MIRFRHACIAIMAATLLGAAAFADSIHDAIRGGQADEVATILAADAAAANAPDETGGAPLHLAARKGLVEIADLLIDAGADMNAVDGRGMTPLRWAIYSLQIETVQALLERGAATDDTHPMFGSVLDQAFTSTCQNNGSADLVKTLAAHGLAFDANHVDAMGMSRLDWACHFGNVPLARFALDRGADANAVSVNLGRTPLIMAIIGGHSELAKELLDRGADPSKVDAKGASPLHYAVTKGRAGVAEQLLYAGATVDARESRSGRTLLHLAAIRGYSDVAALLLKHNHDINPVDSQNFTPLDLASRYANASIAELLQAGGARGSSAQSEAASRGVLEDELTDGKAKVWYLNHRGWAIQTANRFLIIDAEEFGVRRPDEPSLANGFLASGELRDSRVVAMYSCYHGAPGEPAYVHYLADTIGAVSFVHQVDDAWRGSSGTTYLKPRADTVVDGVRIRTIASLEGMPALAYLLDIDGLTIYYQAFATDNPETLKKGLTWLSQFAETVDLAIVPVPEPDAGGATDAAMAFDAFSVRAMCFGDPERRTHLYPTAAKKLTASGAQAEFFFSENPGDAFEMAL